MIPREQLPGFHATRVDDLWQAKLQALAARHGAHWMRFQRNILDSLESLRAEVEQAVAQVTNDRERAEMLAAVDCLRWNLDRLPEILSASNWRHHWKQMSREGVACFTFEHTDEFQACFEARLQGKVLHLPKAGVQTPMGRVQVGRESRTDRDMLAVERGWTFGYWTIIARNRQACALSELETQWRRLQSTQQQARPKPVKILAPNTHLVMPAALVERLEAMGRSAVHDAVGPQLIVRNGLRQPVRLRLTPMELRHLPDFARQPDDHAHWSLRARHADSVYRMFKHMPMTRQMGYLGAEPATMTRLQWTVEGVPSNARRHRELFYG